MPGRIPRITGYPWGKTSFRALWRSGGRGVTVYFNRCAGREPLKKDTATVRTDDTIGKGSEDDIASRGSPPSNAKSAQSSGRQLKKPVTVRAMWLRAVLPASSLVVCRL